MVYSTKRFTLFNSAAIIKHSRTYSSSSSSSSSYHPRYHQNESILVSRVSLQPELIIGTSISGWCVIKLVWLRKVRKIIGLATSKVIIIYVFETG